MLLPNKTRKQVRNRFNRASREEPERLEQCWNTKVAIGVSNYATKRLETDSHAISRRRRRPRPSCQH